jgi:TonB family protein
MMMRLVSFFFLSLTLHATLLVYSISFGGRSPVDSLYVTILPMGQEGGGAGGSGNAAAPRELKSHRATPPAIESRVEPKSLANPEPQVFSAETVTKLSDNSIALDSAIANAAETVDGEIYSSASNDANVLGTGLGGTGTGSGFGTSGAASGPGSGNGKGSGSSGNGSAAAQARYRDTPKPDYPDSARREGREGRVLLRVLVDDQGRSKKVEINSSSGNDALDRAAAEAIKRWRFHPARSGDQPIESWVSVPIDFRLTETKN